MPEDRWIRVSEAEKMFDAVAEELGKELAKRMQEDFMYWREGPVPQDLGFRKMLLQFDGGARLYGTPAWYATQNPSITHYMIVKEPA